MASRSDDELALAKQRELDDERARLPTRWRSLPEESSLVSLACVSPDPATPADALLGGAASLRPSVLPVARLTPPGDLSVLLPVALQPSTVMVELQRPAGPLERVRALGLPPRAGAAERVYRAKAPPGWLGGEGQLVPIAMFGSEELRGRPLPLSLSPAGGVASVSSSPMPKVTGAAPNQALTPSRFGASLEFIARVEVRLKEPVIIGKTPEGLRIDFFVESGTARGPKFNAEVLEDTVDYMLVRPDDIGLINVHALLRTDDGALLTAAYNGMIDFGPGGYERMARRDFPKISPLQLAPRLLTEDARYAELNKTYLLGVGQADLERFVVTYDAFAVTTVAVPTPAR